MSESSLILESDKRDLVLALLSDGKEVRLKMQGNSMFPTIKSSEFTVIEPIDLTTLKVGQVIVFKDGKRWVAHRLIQKKNERFITQGDSMISPDLPIEKHQLIGTVKSVREKFCYVKLRPFPQFLNRLMLFATRTFKRVLKS